MPFRSQAQRRLFYAKMNQGEISPKTVKHWEDATAKKKSLPEYVKTAAFFNELSKVAVSIDDLEAPAPPVAQLRAIHGLTKRSNWTDIEPTGHEGTTYRAPKVPWSKEKDSSWEDQQKTAATVLMKELSPAAKKLMQRMTGFTGAAEQQATRSARQLRHALTGPKAPELMTEMHGMGKLLSPSERAARGQATGHFNSVLSQQGKVYKAAPGTEQAIGSIAGHPRTLTRTGTAMVPQAPSQAVATAVQRPAAARRLGTAPTMMAPIGTAQTLMARPAATF